MKHCDNKSVGVIVFNQEGHLALLERGRFPIGMAPVAGHVDDHGSLEQAAIDEANEEVGLQLSISGLTRTIIQNRTVPNVCRRPGGDHHIWTVYCADIDTAELVGDAHETKQVGWYSPSEVQQFADRTNSYTQGHITEADWTARPGLEPVWFSFLTELGIVRVSNIT